MFRKTGTLGSWVTIFWPVTIVINPKRQLCLLLLYPMWILTYPSSLCPWIRLQVLREYTELSQLPYTCHRRQASRKQGSWIQGCCLLMVYGWVSPEEPPSTGRSFLTQGYTLYWGQSAFNGWLIGEHKGWSLCLSLGHLWRATLDLEHQWW